MSKTAYITISDLHSSYKNKENRFNYLEEIDYSIQRIINTGTRYKQQGYKVVLLFLGDIVDMSFKDMNKGIWLNNLFVKLRMMFDGIYCTIGNHEFTYYKDNPFWTLMTKIDSKEILSSINSTWKPAGLLQLVDVVDTLEDGEVLFNFNHHPTRIQKPKEGKINFGLFHKNLVPSVIAEQMEKEKGMDIWGDSLEDFVNTNLLDGYDYCFMGHVHKIYGHFIFTNDTSNYLSHLYYLASLGRPNHSEVKDTFLERNLPATLVENGKLIRVEDNLFDLPTRTSSVIQEVVDEQQKTYKEVKEKREYYENIVSMGNPIENIRGSLAKNPMLLIKFDSYLQNDRTQEEHDLMNEVEKVKWL